MEVELINIHFSADLYDVKEEFARILHSEHFTRYSPVVDEEPRAMNFHVELGRSKKGGHDGTGILVLPNRNIGKKLLQLAKENEIFPSIDRRRIKLRDSGRKPKNTFIETLRKLPFQDPSIDRERNNVLFKLSTSWRIERLQFGVWLPKYRGAKRPGIFAVEWEKDYAIAGNAQLEFVYDRKLIRLRLGDPFSDDEAHYVLIKFAIVQNLWVGYEFRPYICFELLTPAIFESQWINQTQVGIAGIDTKKIRQRVVALDEHHRCIGPYAYQIRVSLYGQGDLEEFIQSCNIAGLRYPMMGDITSERHDFFSQKLLSKVRKSFTLFQDLPWTVVFQIECLLYNGLLTTVQFLEGLLPSLTKLARAHPSTVAIILRDFSQTLLTGFVGCVTPHDVAQRFEHFYADRLDSALQESTTLAMQDEEVDGLLACHHVTFTPTRRLLEGPYVIRSNRVLRQYIGFHDYFLRVDFRDEDRLQFRWDREVDGTTLLEQLVGGTLRDGFELGGRQFEFLAYSNSSLREHSVWFVSPFLHPEKGLVNAATIRSKIGDLTNELAYPAKFGARMGLAFSGTNPSVKIHRSDWTTVGDLGTDPYYHTDGVGTISRDLARSIWEEECRMNPKLRQYAEPCAYQIRFLGFKGVVAVDDNLKGVKMRLRHSMKKFEIHDVEVADIEIANVFCSPAPLYLNRPLVMILEDQGVDKGSILRLLDTAIANVHVARDSVDHFVAVMSSHGLGSTFGLNSLLRRLASFGLDLNAKSSKSFRTPFVDKLINSTIANILRDIQFRCRIPVPNSYTLVGVIDEGPAYIEKGEYTEDEVFTLDEQSIFVCIQENAESEPVYLERRCTIWRSPTLYPGDVRHCYAIGKPRTDKFCAFRDLVNVVVFPSKGKRSFASCLSGGDLDGDIFNVCQYQPLFGRFYDEPAEFPPVDKSEIDVSDLTDVNAETGESYIDQEKIIPHLCDFVVRYIKSDVMGLLADQHIVRADQSADGVRDRGCLLLAKLCNQAVDYPKNGKEVDISQVPLKLMPYKPDWKKNEAGDERRTDFYRSERAVGEVYRRVEQVAFSQDFVGNRESEYLPVSEHPIYIALKTRVETKLRGVQQTTEDIVRRVFRRYSHELEYICATHTLTDHFDARLKEEEVVIGTILARCSRHRWRTERIYRMGVHASNLVKETRAKFISKKLQEMTVDETTAALEFAWTSWKHIIDKLSTEDARKNSFGLNSFAIITLNIVLECLGHLNGEWR